MSDDLNDSLEDILPMPPQGSDRGDQPVPTHGEPIGAMEAYEALAGLRDGRYVIADLAGKPLFVVIVETDSKGRRRSIATPYRDVVAPARATGRGNRATGGGLNRGPRHILNSVRDK